MEAAHPFLSGRVVEQACFSTTRSASNATSLCPGGAASSTAPGSAAPCSGATGCSHGTHVAGIAAGRARGNITFNGVARDANIFAVQIFSRFEDARGITPCRDVGLTSPCALSYISDQISGLERVRQRAAARNVVAANMSLGGGYYRETCDSDSRKAVIDELFASGVATVISSGNDGFSDGVGSPGCISSAVTVGAVDDADDVANLSNSSSVVDLLAPGVGIVSSVPGGGFTAFDGTSMAAPHVAGAFAVVRSRIPNAHINEILYALLTTGVPVTDPESGVVRQRIDVEAALNARTIAPLWSSVPSDAAGWALPQHFSTIDFPDLDGDGRADGCGRGSAGVLCATSTGSTFGVFSNWYAGFSDAAGWTRPEYYDTIRFVDINADGRDDVCSRTPAGVRCVLSNGSRFDRVVEQPEPRDSAGWNRPEYYSTLEFPDIDGDGDADLCGRGGAGVLCAIYDGTTFGSLRPWNSAFNDARRWSQPQYYETITFPDVNRDGRADLCGRGPNGVECATSNGVAFTNMALWNDTFRDNAGWAVGPQYYGTIAFPDIDGDGDADLCGRGSQGVHCALSDGRSFTTRALWNTTFSDANGWTAPEYYSTLQFADINHDGRADLCSRAPGGIECATSNGSAFINLQLWDQNVSDASGWNQGPHYYSTLRFPDVTGDGRADLCGRGISGIHCMLSNGNRFTAF